MSETKKLPALDQIKWDDLEQYGLDQRHNAELRNFMLNQNPPQNWIKKHPYGGFQYLPIDKIEYLLTKFFKHWYVEILEINQMANGAYCRVRLYYKDQSSDGYLHQDGAGAASFQVNSGAKPSDMSSIKQNAVEIAVPKAETVAIKDAADKIGRIFGRDIGRRDIMEYGIDSSRFNETFKNLNK